MKRLETGFPACQCVCEPLNPGIPPGGCNRRVPERTGSANGQYPERYAYADREHLSADDDHCPGPARDLYGCQ